MTVRPRFLPSRRQLLPLGLGLVVLLLLSRLPADPDRLVPAGLERSFFPGLAARFDF